MVNVAVLYLLLHFHLAPIIYITALKQNKVNYYMPKTDQHFKEQVEDLLEREEELHRYLALIRLLDRKAKIAEKELNAAQREYNRAFQSGEEKRSKESAEKVMTIFRTVYGLSKEKIEVCSQCSHYLSLLNADLLLLKKIRDQVPAKLRKRASYAKFDSESSEGFEDQATSCKSKIKQIKLITHGHHVF